MSNEASSVLATVKSLKEQLDDTSNETKSLTTRIANLEDQIDVLKNHGIQDTEGNTSTIPYPTKVSKVSSNSVKKKPIAEDVKDALAVLRPSVPVDETYNSVLKYCTARSDEVVKTLYNKKLPTWKHVPTSIRIKMKDRNTNGDNKNKSDAEEEGENENNEAAVSLPQKRKSKLYLLLLASVWRDFQKP
ncbi:hypothetical protein BD560DRAFT_420918 [Blakeslea trispora]|nr:hypothetical protein BD560DRAFT_420918 [Blakeslea trispora]